MKNAVLNYQDFFLQKDELLRLTLLGSSLRDLVLFICLPDITR